MWRARNRRGPQKSKSLSSRSSLRTREGRKEEPCKKPETIVRTGAKLLTAKFAKDAQEREEELKKALDQLYCRGFAARVLAERSMLWRTRSAT